MPELGQSRLQLHRQFESPMAVFCMSDVFHNSVFNHDSCNLVGLILMLASPSSEPQLLHVTLVFRVWKLERRQITCHCSGKIILVSASRTFQFRVWSLELQKSQLVRCFYQLVLREHQSPFMHAIFVLRSTSSLAEL